MRLSCKLCGQAFEVLPDILDKALAMREASGKLMMHVNHSHSQRTGNIADRLTALVTIAGWIFTMQEFSKPDVGSQEEYEAAMKITLDTAVQLIHNKVPSAVSNASTKPS